MSSTGKKFYDLVNKIEVEIGWLFFAIVTGLAILFLTFVAQSGWFLGMISFVTFVVVGFTGIFMLSWLFHWLDKRFYG